MDVHLVDSPVEFLEQAGPLLLADEPRHNLMLGLAAALGDHPALYGDHRLWLVESDGEVVGAALRTPPWPLVLARPATDAALAALAEGIEGELPGVVGALPEVEVFTRLWSSRTGVAEHRRIDQGIYALSRLRPVTGVPGAAREASRVDKELVMAWWHAFTVEAMHEAEPEEAALEQAVEHRLAESGWGIALWDDGGETVSLTGFGGTTPNGVRIGPVYTPPDRRGRGYASALVAAVSAARLAEGRRFCFLYTDLANPISNRIYERIGYERVCESAEIRFA